MNIQTYTQDKLLDIIIEIAYPDPKERQNIDREKIKKHFDEFDSFIKHCRKNPDFMDCMIDFELDFLERDQE